MFRYDRSAIAADHKIRLFTCICAIFWCHKMKLRKVMALAASPSTAIQVAGHRFSLQNAQLIAAVFGRVTTQSTPSVMPSRVTTFTTGWLFGPSMARILRTRCARVASASCLAIDSVPALRAQRYGRSSESMSTGHCHGPPHPRPPFLFGAFQSN